MKKIYLMISVLLVFTLLLVGCSTETPEVKEPIKQEVSESNTDKPKEEEQKVEEDNKTEALEEVFSAKLIEMMKSKHYTMKMNTIVELDDKQYEVKTTTVVDGERSAIIMESDAISMKTILKDNKAYIVMDDQKMIMVAPMDEEDNDPGFGEIDFQKIEYIGKGNGLFLGEERKYEEYQVEDGKIRYYFDGKDIDGIEMIYDDTSTIMDIEHYSNDVDSSIFELPEGYTILGE